MAEEKHRINKLKLDKVPPSFMSFEDLLLPIVISLVIGFILGFFALKLKSLRLKTSTAWNWRCGNSKQRARSEKILVNRSRSTLKGKIAEQQAPVAPGF